MDIDEVAIVDYHQMDISPNKLDHFYHIWSMIHSVLSSCQKHCPCLQTAKIGHVEDILVHIFLSNIVQDDYVQVPKCLQKPQVLVPIKNDISVFRRILSCNA